MCCACLRSMAAPLMKLCSCTCVCALLCREAIDPLIMWIDSQLGGGSGPVEQEPSSQQRPGASPGGPRCRCACPSTPCLLAGCSLSAFLVPGAAWDAQHTHSCQVNSLPRLPPTGRHQR